jgi:DNA-binding NarL/FixJ family response regulator
LKAELPIPAQEDFVAPESVKVFVVDDHEPWRRFICSTLEKQPQLHVIGSATDGFEAVKKARELAPDLIVLDVGLPNLNGIEAARRIRELAPQTRVLMVSEYGLAEIAESAFRMGALGYVVKSHAAVELLPAVEAVLQGRRFVSTFLTGVPLSRPRKVSPPGLHRSPEEDPRPPQELERRRRHEVEFYPDHAAFVAGFTRFVESSIKNGSAVIVIASEFHRSRVFQKLKADGVDAEAMIEDGRLFSFDAEETLSTFMVNDVPDPVRCAQTVDDVITGAASHAKGKYPQVAICGECAPTLLAKGKTEAAIRVEHLWDVITEGYDADTLCGYVWSAIPCEERSLVVARLCEEHSSVRGRELGDQTFA